MKLETVQIDLGHGDYATAYKDELRVTARLHTAELRKHMTPVAPVNLSDIKADAPAAKPDYQVDFAGIDDDAINEIFILNQVTGWTFGPVDRETLDTKVTKEQYEILVRELDRLYKPSPLSKPAAGAKN